VNISIDRYIALLAEYLRPQARRVVVLALILLGSIAVQLMNPQLVKRFIDTATTGGEMSRLLVLAGIFVAAAVAGQALTIAAAWLSESIGWTATNELRARLLDHCLRLDMSFHKSRTPGEMIERVDGDVNAISHFFSQFVVYVLTNAVLLVGVLVLLYLEDLRVGLALSVFAAVALFFMLRLRSIAVPHWTAEREAAAQYFGFLGEQLSSTEDIRANGGRDWVMMRFYQNGRVWLRHRVWGMAMSSLMWASSIASFSVAHAIAFALGAWLYRAGDISIGTVYVIFYYTELLRRPIELIRAQLQELQTASAGIGRVEQLLDLEPAIKDGPGVAVPLGALSLEFDHVSFGYEDGEAVLEDVSFKVAPGRVLGLLGRTGSGKTTIARLVSRLYDPDSGDVRLGGACVRDARLADLRARTGMVTQDVQIFDATIRDNLTFFDTTISDERLLAVIEEIGLRRWFEAQPRGLDTRISAAGLSAGEAQLLAFARLFLRDPGLVILDEASSRLDPATERLIERAVSKLLEGRTALLIAHRLSTIERADDVLVLEDGRVAEHGPRAALAADGGSRLAHLLAADAQGVPA
jgi:ATP-binding cassette subfamily B protein